MRNCRQTFERENQTHNGLERYSYNSCFSRKPHVFLINFLNSDKCQQVQTRCLHCCMFHILPHVFLMHHIHPHLFKLHFNAAIPLKT